MRFSQYQYPDTQTLTDNIRSAIRANCSLDGQINILTREPNSAASSFPSEIVTCQLPDDNELQLICKYSVKRSYNTYGHQNGLFYEAEVYRRVLQRMQISSPKFYGVHHNQMNEEIWLIIEYFEDSTPVKYLVDLSVLQAAAHWLGQFHRFNESILSEASLRFLNRYDDEYYKGWAERTSLFAGNLHQRFPWLANLCNEFGQIGDTLMRPPLIIIHGEYYPVNIIFSEGKIYPVDWESAAIASGEIDLACLIEKWPLEYKSAAQAEYQRARWPDGSPANFEHRFTSAQLYIQFRWLGERPRQTLKEKNLWRFEEIHSLSERMGLI